MIEISINFMFFVLSFIAIPIIGFYLYSMYKLFEKCDVEPWKGLVPIYNIFIEIKLAGLNWWYILLIIGSIILSIDAGTGLSLLCTIVVMFVNSLIAYNLCKKINNGKNSLIVDFLLLTFVPYIYIPVMAFNDEFVYNKDVETTPNAYIDEIQTSDLNINISDKNKKSKKNNKKINFCSKCGEPISSGTNYCPNCGKKV